MVSRVCRVRVESLLTIRSGSHPFSASLVATCDFYSRGELAHHTQDRLQITSALICR